MDALKQLQKKLTLPFLTGCGVFVLGLLVMWGMLARAYGVECLKAELNKMVTTLNKYGYDIAYDNIKFSSVSPFKMMEIENLMLYSFDKQNYKAVKIPSLSVNASLWDYRKLNVKIAPQQMWSFGDTDYQAEAETSDMLVSFDENGMYNLLLVMNNYQINGVAKAKTIRIAMQKDDTTNEYIMKNFWDIRNVKLLTENTWNMANEIEELYADFEIKETTNIMPSGDEIRNAHIDVNKFIINWKPLVMVARGAVEFDDANKPVAKLISTSKELIPTLDNLEKAQVIDSKGAFVAKIILGKKTQQIIEGEDYYTIISPLEISPDKITLESIPLWTTEAVVQTGAV